MQSNWLMASHVCRYD